jgi:N-acetylglutamate synthase-like GNAT family acetyltransferase
MEPGDVERAARLLRACYAFLAEEEGLGEERFEALVRERGSPEALREQMEAYKIFVLEREGILRGLVALKGAEITKLFVHPEEIRSGVGAMLFEIAQRNVVRAGHDILLVRTTETAIPFYLSMGMETVETKPAPAGPLQGTDITTLKKALQTTATTKLLKPEGDPHL